MKENTFETIKRIDNNGKEYWSSRELAKALEYTDYRNFLTVVNKAKIACENSGEVIHNHFVDANEMVKIGSGAEKPVEIIYLSRYACYLIVQNSDPTKIVVAKGQTYFAVQTRRQERADNLIEDHNRVFLREEMKKHNTNLMKTASMAGVESYAIFQNAGYKGLYGGLTMQDIHTRKKLKKSQRILDHMNSEELAANLFRATQTDAKIKRENIRGQGNANLAHYDVGQKVRNTIANLGGTMPEKLPAPDAIGKAQMRIKKSKQIKKIGDGKGKLEKSKD
ncbi:MAG: DNA damage-inducible protein D [Candidatus Taylorbacteria bacterium RIFCSPLOWO2_12_FULL_44_15c]|uniref:DNA damage-inducible protein D n=1 Tax=Candidatus Taylorbacteria bacterium RIFCSPLOWO2_12_FULL_44_15c TaxID=1802333 RepID=A0A1G2P7Y7_9BACT|nr:MAG: DNA damage-inducible protein D [Candidatus Taylorbacteria bacterium RIFCSPLOWO2_02_FULL_44_35]OHA44430.1 MAG: DNA damage-inducible protein D [Candidatus Taylorbacteria bacterium RIFCSPLOWO2_12_FULL_44_15c]